MLKKIGFFGMGILLLCLLVGGYLAWNSVWQLRDRIYEKQYDAQNENKTVKSKQAIDKIFANLEKLSYKQLDQGYIEYSKSNTPKYQSLVNNLTHCIVKRSDLNKKIVGDFRIKEFLCKDKYYKACILNKSEDIHCILNKKIFYKTLELQEELEKMGHNKNAFYIVNGHRHPRYNEGVGGASLSRHIKGEAVDISIGDINRDGQSNQEDKKIVLDLLENKIIKNEGGIGLYPGTKSVHYDVRGKRARWNTY